MDHLAAFEDDHHLMSHPWIVWLCYLLLLLISIGSLVLVAVTLPGLWLMAGAAAGYALLTHEKYLGINTLIALALLALIAEIIDTMAAGAAAKKAGGGKGAVVGGIVGALLGGFLLSFVLLFPVGTILGVCLGSFVGAAGMELLGGQESGKAMRIGWRATKGKVMGIVAKLVFGGVMFLLIAWTALP